MNSLSDFNLVLDSASHLTSLDLTRVKMVPGGLAAIAEATAQGKLTKVVLDCLKISGMDDVLATLLSKSMALCHRAEKNTAKT